MRGKLVIAAGALALGLTGCVAYPADPYYGTYYDGYDGYQGSGYYAAPVVSGTVVYSDRGRYRDRGYYRDRGRHDRHDHDRDGRRHRHNHR